MSSDPAPDEGGTGEEAPDEATPGASTDATSGTTTDATPCTYTEYVEGDDADEYPATGEDAEGLAADVWSVLREVDDPEMPVSIVDLGLIYGIDVTDGGPEEPHGARESDGAHATIEMTLTYTGCPARKYLTEEIEQRVAAVDGVESVDLDLVWSPPWTVEMVTDAGKEQLGEFGLSI